MKQPGRLRRWRGDLPPGGSELEPSVDVITVLRSIRSIPESVTSDLDADGAERIAEAVLTALGASAVGVTDLDGLLASIGHLPSDQTIEDQTQALLDRRRWDQLTAYEAAIERDRVQMTACVLAVDNVPAGTIHVLYRDASMQSMDVFGEVVETVGAQLLANELRLERSAAAVSELRALRAQISPHFIHNSLSAIAGFVHQDPKRARTLIIRFAEFLRASFRTDAEFTTVAEEIRLVEIYLELEHARFGDRFEITLRVAPEVLSVRLPFLTMQPIVENAIRHGLEHRPDGGRLVIVVEDHLSEARINVDDNGVGTDPDALLEALQGRRSSHHIGVLAVDERLRSAFGPEYGLVISTGTDQGTNVSMRIPKSGGAGR